MLTLQRYGKTTASVYGLIGNLRMDLNKGLHINEYNSLNLPAWIEVNSPVAEAMAYYNYTASGQKIMAYHMYNMNRALNPVTGATVENITGYPVRDELLTSQLVTSYVGNKVYENGTLKRILVDGGYIEDGVYHYYVTDHLGNNRIVANSSGTVVQSTQYYPFGMSFADAAGTGAQPYKYNGKELDQMHGLNLYDYSARYMDAAIGRFTTVDPLAEKYYSISPYAYCNNNPIKFIDPTGMSYIYNWTINRYEDKDGNEEVEWETVQNSLHDNDNPPKKDEPRDPLLYISATGDAAGGFSTGISDIPGTFRIQGGDNNPKIFSPKYYASGFTGEGSTVKTYNISNASKIIGKMSIASTIIVGGAVIYDGVQKDGGTFGDNAQIATGGVVGGIVFSYIGAEIGTVAGNAVGSAIPIPVVGQKVVSIIGCMFGSIAGGIFGVNVGEQFVKDLKGIK
jgi:RHS repeat-associated protein